MSDWGIKISKPGFSTAVAITEITKKNYIVIDENQSHKLLYKVQQVSGVFSHSLGYKPIIDVVAHQPSSSPARWYTCRSRVNTTTVTVATSTFELGFDPDYYEFFVYNEGA